MAKRATLRLQAMGSVDPRSANSSASPTASSTTGARTGLLRPTLAEARGSGTKRRYSYHDVLELKVIKQLLDAGVSLQMARRAVECLRLDLGADLASANLVLTGTHSSWPTATGRSSTSSPVARACSTSCRCRESWTSWLPTFVRIERGEPATSGPAGPVPATSPRAAGE